MAEFVMKDLVEKAGISAQFEIASAATSTEEIGNPVYPPAQHRLPGRMRCSQTNSPDSLVPISTSRGTSSRAKHCPKSTM